MDKIFFNFFEIITSKNEVNINYLLFEDQEQLNSLRENYPHTVFMKFGDRIYIWGEDESMSEGLVVINKNNDRNIFLAILREGLFYTFYRETEKYKLRRKLVTYDLTFLEKDISNGVFQGLRFNSKYSINFQPLFFNEKQHLGFTISYSVKEHAYWTKKEFEDKNINYDKLEFDEETQIVYGNIHTINSLAKYFSYSNKRKEKLDNLNSIQNEYREINNFVNNYFDKNKENAVLPDGLKIIQLNKNVINLDAPQQLFDSKILVEPKKFFYKGITPSHLHYNPPLKKKIAYNKPFSNDNFENRKINLTIIYPKSEYSAVRNFFKHVQDELIDTLKIQKNNFKYETIEIENFELNSYKKIISQVKNSDLVIVIVSELHESLVPNMSPYYFCKLKFMEQGLNVQDIQIQQIEKYLKDKSDNFNNYNADNLALNIYAKLGGMAWTIKPHEPKNELVIGIGATTDKEGKPVLGLASIFRGDGKYLFGKMSSVTLMDNYRENLQALLTENIKKCINEGIIETDTPFHLIFHVFKSTGKDNEIKALNNVIKEFSNYQFNYSFVHIGFGHNYRCFMYNEDNSNIKFSTDKKGIAQNERGTLVKINNKLGLLCLSSISSSFCKIEIDKRSSITDLDYIAKQVYEFTELSHTSYKKSGKPVTIKYPNRMADFAQKFSEIDGFYLDELQMPDKSLWFI